MKKKESREKEYLKSVVTAEPAVTYSAHFQNLTGTSRIDGQTVLNRHSWVEGGVAVIAQQDHGTEQRRVGDVQAVVEFVNYRIKLVFRVQVTESNHCT